MNKCYTFLDSPLLENTTEIYLHGEIGENWMDVSAKTSGDFIRELNDIPKDRNIVLRINSPGGSITDALAMHDVLKERKEKCVCRIDCLCASAATFFFDAVSKVIANENAEIMLHKPWVDAGPCNADDHRYWADKLDIWEKKMISLYKEKSGLSEDELSKILRNETWLTPQEALDFGFIDEIISYSDDEKNKNEAAMASLDFSGFKKHEDFLKRKSENKKIKENNNMYIRSIVESAARAGKIKESEIDSWVDKITKDISLLTTLENLPVDSSILIKKLEDEKNALLLEKEKQEAAANKAKKQNISADVTKAVEDGRIKNTDHEKWVNLIFQNEDNRSILDSLNPAPKPGIPMQEPLIEEVSPDVRSIAGGIKNSTGKNRQHIIQENYKKLKGYLLEMNNSISIDSGLKQDVIMSTALNQFKYVTAPVIQLFSTMFKDVPMEGTDTISLPYYPLWNQTTRQFYYEGESPNTNTNPEGYVVDPQYTVQKKSITCDKRQYVGFNWTSRDISRTPFFILNEFFSRMGSDLGYKLWLTLQSEITASNFPTKAFASDIALSAFNSDKIADVKLKCESEQWQPSSRNLVINSVFENQLLKDPAIKNFSAINTDSVIRNGAIPSLFGFNIIANPNIPNNNQRLFGYACMKEALGIVNCPIQKEEHIPGQYEQATDPETGMTLEARWFGDGSKDKATVVLEFNAGWAVLEPKALIRLVQASS